MRAVQGLGTWLACRLQAESSFSMGVLLTTSNRLCSEILVPPAPLVASVSPSVPCQAVPQSNFIIAPSGFLAQEAVCFIRICPR
jgi:hypothetical protein